MVVSVSTHPIWSVAKIVNKQLQNTSQMCLHSVIEHVMTS